MSTDARAHVCASVYARAYIDAYVRTPVCADVHLHVQASCVHVYVLHLDQHTCHDPCAPDCILIVAMHQH